LTPDRDYSDYSWDLLSEPRCPHNMGTSELNAGGNPLDGLETHVREGRRTTPSPSMLHTTREKCQLMGQ